MAQLREFTGPNAAYVLDLFERYQRDPASVDEGWAGWFASLSPADLQALEGTPAPAPAASGTVPQADFAKALAARELARSIRGRGHTAARLNPLGGEPDVDPILDPAYHGITEADLAALPASVVVGHRSDAPNALAEIQRLRGIYSGTVGWEFLHLPNPEERSWLREAVESGEYARPLPAERRRALLDRVSQVEGFERFLHRAFFGQKRFSIEGTDLMVPMLDEVISEAARAGAGDVLIGMAHRGRLNVLTHVLGKPYSMMLAGFASAAAAPSLDAYQNSDEPSGDVKYHMGWSDTRQVEGREMRVRLSPNPSHLEFVGPVVVGMTRAAQDDTTGPGAPTVDPKRAVAVLIHGDAAFPGQGTVPETFNMQSLPGYAVGGTLHVIANNQVGFTTDPQQGRSTRYASDLAKGFEVPVVHVNADDAEACLAVARLAFAYRARWSKDIVIDLVGYRRWGHNEGDEPLFTQPVMYGVIKDHPTAREVYAARLVEDGVLTREEADAAYQRVLDELSKTLENLGDSAAHPHDEPSPNGRGGSETAVSRDVLLELNGGLTARPEGFVPNARLEKVLQKRAEAGNGEKNIDWGHAEALAFASLLAEGTPIRITGQDVERGTFSHRHAVLRDAGTGARMNVFHLLPQSKASFEIHNSPLSEMAVMGFEYGYSVADPASLVLWEAQFGDFVNGAQVMIDQYLASSHQKWDQRSGLVLLLPHGYEGQGPEHSSARLERFLQLCAEDNLRVANCTTSANYFHLLRRQAALLQGDPRPLVVMSPKSLLRHPLALSSIDQLASGEFQPVIADASAAERAEGITRLVLCSGKVYVDLVGSTEDHRKERAAVEGIERVAIGRVEELYPFPAEQIAALAATYPNLREVVWVQEEPRNMGAWSFIAPRLAAVIGEVPLRYEGRPERASPAEGYMHRHLAEQNRLVFAALKDAPEAAAPGRAARLIGKRKS
ncbi:2-oxoglutarate dehydrogenase E1 component [Longimicrobium terrae]|uniref:oxoglutarate dehydrogenase (succinyl-transferring) n=1 Tax=Longimicrobium terrae TaxID=1639882 RepID=A0A841GY44_9BACT|nr:2-oxoglutarate dehydrogenase E1 component [Longimicrobium terrae]MBB4636289.1 2-oxoglutarate dehydrogenase E1 component [Longimicrobium terrae]MBB6070685.1 2-oxoglutarate dehydrogenase E1 component [Longimicrobium terrae]NNC29667.1 2-oxoglutarate dehydrogenase E1 component [Longimicrobium terrae]